MKIQTHESTISNSIKAILINKTKTHYNGFSTCETNNKQTKI